MWILNNVKLIASTFKCIQEGWVKVALIFTLFKYFDKNIHIPNIELESVKKRQIPIF